MINLISKPAKKLLTNAEKAQNEVVGFLREFDQSRSGQIVKYKVIMLANEAKKIADAINKIIKEGQ